MDEIILAVFGDTVSLSSPEELLTGSGFCFIHVVPGTVPLCANTCSGVGHFFLFNHLHTGPWAGRHHLFRFREFQH